MGLIMGGFIGYTLNDTIKKLNDGCRLKAGCYTLYVEREKTQPSQNFVTMKKTKESIPVDGDNNKKCNTCEDEDMYLKGTKHLIPCPKCKRNANKFKKLPSM